jgi:hypothetical protein
MGHLRAHSFIEKIILYLTLPYHFIIITIKVFILQGPNRNPIATKTKTTGKKKGGFAKDYPLTDIKQKCKEHGATVNDFIMAIVSLTLKEYFIS